MTCIRNNKLNAGHDQGCQRDLVLFWFWQLGSEDRRGEKWLEC